MGDETDATPARRHRPRLSRIGLATTSLVAVLLVPGTGGAAPTPGDNVNMVSGRSFPGGDPFLQRQSEPSLALSTRNPSHLLAGAIDFRGFDLPGPETDLNGSSWLGVFKSFDGTSWQSTLLPGYLQDNSVAGQASPLKAFTAATDPVVRAGTNGLFYYAGIGLNAATERSGVFVARFIDGNDKENGDATQGRDPIRYLDTILVDTAKGHFSLVEPALAVDIPRAGASTCMIAGSPAQSFPVGGVYLAYTRLAGDTGSDIVFTSSTDCGQSWARPKTISTGQHLSQGPSVAVDPATGAVYVTWRRFAHASQTPAIVFTGSLDGGRTFTKPSVIDPIIPFDQPTTSDSFRTNTLPSIAVGLEGGTSRIFVAWSQRSAANADARVVISQSADGGNSWSAPTAVDSAPIVDDAGHTYNQGHQFMPTVTTAGGKLFIAYYDQRLDHTVQTLTPNNPFAPGPDGSFYRVTFEPRGELLTNPGLVYTPFITDAGLTQRRHTIDLRVAQSDIGPVLTFTPTQVTRFPVGTLGDPTLQQLEVNPPNLPIFQQGTVPSIGGAIDIAGLSFVPEGTSWRFNNSSDPAVVYPAWTSNQDVVPPRDGNWIHYTPVGGGGPSVFDPTKTTPPCVPGQEGTRNQNVYNSVVTRGLQVTSPQNTKPLSPTLERGFVLQLRNSTPRDLPVRLTIANQPVDGSASFLPATSSESCPLGGGGACTTLDVAIGAHSSVARTVFAMSTNPAARIGVEVDEVSGIGGVVVPGGLSGSLLLNPDPTVPPLRNPDGVGPGMDISTQEVHTASISGAIVGSPNQGMPIASPDIFTGTPNGTVPNADIADRSATVTGPFNGVLVNPDLASQSLGQAAVSDATYLVRNTGNTTSSYRIRLVGQNPGAAMQLIVTKPHVIANSYNCSLQLGAQNIVAANVIEPQVTPPTNLTDAAITDPFPANATVSLRPGELAQVTLRLPVDPATAMEMTNDLVPVVVPHAPSTGDTQPMFAAPLFITTTTGDLPTGTAGQSYSADLHAIGGATPYQWGILSGSLPPGDTLDPATGHIDGTPTTSGMFTANVGVTDSSATPETAARSLTFTVLPPPLTCTGGSGGSGLNAANVFFSCDQPVTNAVIQFPMQIVGAGFVNAPGSVVSCSPATVSSPNDALACTFNPDLAASVTANGFVLLAGLFDCAEPPLLFAVNETTTGGPFPLPCH